MIKRILAILMCMLFVQSFTAFAAEDDSVTYFVSANAEESGDGSFESPFKTLDEAKAAVKKLKDGNAYPEKGVTVYLRGGQYKVPHSFKLEEGDGGTETGPVTYSSYGNEQVTLVGGAEIDFSDFRISSDSRIRSEAAGKVYSYNLRDNDIEDYGELSVTGHSQYYLYTAGWATSDGGNPTPTVLFDEKTMTLARYPNEGYTYIEKVYDKGGFGDKNVDPDATMQGMSFSVTDSRVANWTTATDPWVFGYWFFDWSDMTTPVTSIDPDTRIVKTKYSTVFSVAENRPVYFYNMLEELDAPGEWFYDKRDGMFYIYPVNENKNAKIVLGFSNDPVIRIEGAEHVVIRGLTCKGTRSVGISVDSNNVKILCCEVSDTSNNGINANGKNILIDGCNVYRIGQRGISINGGAIDDLSNNIVSNNIIHDVAQKTRMMMPGIICQGCGVTVRNNLVYNCPQIGINFSGCFNVIEYNHIHDVMQESTDGGAIYAGQRYEHWGNVLRGNVIHNVRYGLGGSYGIYLDDCLSGTTVTENVIYNIGGTGIFNQGGRSNTYTKNVIANSGAGISIVGFMGDNNPRTVWNFVSEEAINDPARRELLGEEFYNIPNDDPVNPKYNKTKDNLVFGCSTGLTVGTGFRPVTIDWMHENNDLEDPIMASGDIFMNAEANNFVIADNTKIVAQHPEFTSVNATDISVAQIQLKKALEESSAAFVIGKPGAFVNYERKLIDTNPETTPFIENDSAYVPLRFFAESIGAEVEYDGENAVIEFESQKMTIGENGIEVDGAKLETENGVIERNGRMYVPIRACGEMFGKEILWRDCGLIIISDKNLEETMTDKLTDALYNRIW